MHTHAREVHLRPHILALLNKGRPLTIDDIRDASFTSWEWEAIVPRLDDAAFVEHFEYVLRNCAPAKRPCVVYDEAAVHVYAPELLQRFARMKAELRGLRETDTPVADAIYIERALKEKAAREQVLRFMPSLIETIADRPIVFRPCATCGGNATGQYTLYDQGKRVVCKGCHNTFRTPEAKEPWWLRLLRWVVS